MFSDTPHHLHDTSRAHSAGRSHGAGSPHDSSRSRRTGRSLRAAGTALAGAVLAGLGLAACSGGPSTSAPPSPASVSSTLSKAIHEQVEGHNAQAVVDFLAVVKADPHNHVAWYDLGVIAHQNGQDAQAARDYQASVAADPTYVPALYNLAILETPAHPQQAATLYRRVVTLQPGDADAHLNLGFVLVTLGRKAEATSQFATAVKLSPALASRVPVADGGTAS